MKIEIKVPQLPESVSEATLLSWHKSPNEFIKREENLIDLETDKVVLELPSPENGTLVEVLAKSGDIVKSGQVIAYIDTSIVPDSVKPDSSAESVSNDKESARANKNDANAINEKPLAPSGASLVASNMAMPSATKIATENNIDLTQIQGSGRDGRILKEDVLNVKQGTTIKGSETLISSIQGNRIEQRVPMTSLRRRIAERLIQSQQTNAILTTFNEVNMKPVMDLRAKYKDVFEKKHGTKLGFMSFFVKAVIHALRQYPIVNASIDGNDIIYHSYFDIGIAVGSPRGLVVPILRNCENLSIAEIETKIADFGKRAKDGKLQIEELTGGTFSITNGGIFGSMMSTPIINPPQSAILGMHSIKERVVVENNEMVIRPMMYLALSYDHRLIDGKEAVSSLVLIKEALEDPARILLDL